jgi:hypothetical protein
VAGWQGGGVAGLRGGVVGERVSQLHATCDRNQKNVLHDPALFLSLSLSHTHTHLVKENARREIEGESADDEIMKKRKSIRLKENRLGQQEDIGEKCESRVAN